MENINKKIKSDSQCVIQLCLANDIGTDTNVNQMRGPLHKHFFIPDCGLKLGILHRNNRTDSLFNTKENM